MTNAHACDGVPLTLDELTALEELSEVAAATAHPALAEVIRERFRRQHGSTKKQ